MFNHNSHDSDHARVTGLASGARRIGAAAGALSLGVGLTLIAPVAANADTAIASYARAQFLSGSLAGLDLDEIVELAAAEAHNNGTQALQTSKDPLSASVLQTVDLDVPGGIQADLGDFLDAGAVNQYAEADKGGASMASAGAIGDDGAIGIGNVGSGAAGDLDLDLDALIDSSFASILTDLKLSLTAVSAQAVGSADTAYGDYTIADAILTFRSPAIGDLTNKVNAALASVDAKLLALGSDDGELGNAVDRVIDPVLGVVGSSANVSVVIDADVRGAIQSLLDGAYGNGAVHFDLETGAVIVDLEALLGGDLNSLDPNTELLSGPVINQVLNGITTTVATLADQIVDRVDAALHNARVEVHADLDLLSAGPTVQDQDCGPVQVPIIGDIVDTTGVGTVLGGLLGGSTGNPLGSVTQGVIGYTTETVCTLVDRVLPDLHSTVAVDIVGTVDQLIEGTSASASAAISLLDGTVSADLDVNAIIGGLGNGLEDGLFGSDGAVSDLIDSLNSGLVNPAVDGLLGPTSVDIVLTDILSIKANVQETSGGAFTETAVRVSVLDDTAVVNLAAATVGPNVDTIVDPGCTTNCGGGTDPNCTVNCGNGGGGGTPGSTTGTAGLAMTGLNLLTLIMVVLALLITGVYLAREGYRRSHSAVLAE